MSSIRRAWNVAYRAHSNLVSEQNPFSKMELKTTQRPTKEATRSQLEQFVQSADALGYSSIGTAALISFEWLLRETDIISKFSWNDYCPSNRPDVVRLHHSKTKEDTWLPLYDENCSLYPELISRLNSLPRCGPLIIMRDDSDKKTGQYLSWKKRWFLRCAEKIREHAALPNDVTFTSFRHGGLTELGDAELTDQGMMALNAHKTRDMLTVYSKPMISSVSRLPDRVLLIGKIEQTRRKVRNETKKPFEIPQNVLT